MPHFILADNQPLTSLALEHLLQGISHGGDIRHADGIESLAQMLSQTDDTLVILDYSLFDLPDAGSLLALLRHHPLSAWVLLSDSLPEPFLRQVVFQARNVSIIFKDAPLKEITEAVRLALRGQRYISQRATEMLLEHQIQAEQHPSVLTPTEAEVMRSIAQGKTTKEIAAERYSSIHTINTHRKNIFRKFSVNTAHEAIKAALRAGILQESDYLI